MTERDTFLKAIAEDENDTNVRLAYADWLDENGEHEEAERQRKWPQAKCSLNDLCRKWNASCESMFGFTYDQLVEFGRRVSAVADQEIVFSGEDYTTDQCIASAIRDQIPEFWRAWCVVTGLPLPSGIEQKSYVSAGYFCCSNEVDPDVYLAGLKPDWFILAEMAQQEEELREQMLRDALLDTIQDKLEKERP